MGRAGLLRLWHHLYGHVDSPTPNRARTAASPFVGSCMLPHCCHDMSRDLGPRRPLFLSRVWKLCMWFGCDEEEWEAQALVADLPAVWFCISCISYCWWVFSRIFVIFLGTAERNWNYTFVPYSYLFSSIQDSFLPQKKKKWFTVHFRKLSWFQSWDLRYAFPRFQEGGKEGMLSFVRNVAYFSLPLGDNRVYLLLDERLVSIA